MEYRTANMHDLPELLRLYRQLNPGDTLLSVEESVEKWKQIENTGICKIFVAADGTTLASSCIISIIPNLTRNGRSYALIENVVTDEKYRRKGIGRQLMTCAIDYAKSYNCYKVLLMSTVQNKDAHNFYTSIGFNGNSKKGFEIRC